MKKRFANTLFVKLEYNNWDGTVYYDAVPNLEEIAELGEEVPFAEYKLVKVGRVKAKLHIEEK